MFLEHKNCMDVMFQVYETLHHDEVCRILRGTWWNHGRNHKCAPWKIGVDQTITIFSEQYKNWKEPNEFR